MIIKGGRYEFKPIETNDAVIKALNDQNYVSHMHETNKNEITSATNTNQNTQQTSETYLN